MKAELAKRRTDRQIFFEIFLLLAVILSLTARLPPLEEWLHADKPDRFTESSFSYLWGRGGDGLTGLFVVPDAESLPTVKPEPWPEKIKLLLHRPMDLNAVSAELLQTVPGIGQELAGRIIRRREQLGGYSNMEELLAVRGIGKGKLRQLAAFLTVADRKVVTRKGN